LLTNVAVADRQTIAVESVCLRAAAINTIAAPQRDSVAVGSAGISLVARICSAISMMFDCVLLSVVHEKKALRGLQNTCLKTSEMVYDTDTTGTMIILAVRRQ